MKRVPNRWTVLGALWRLVTFGWLAGEYKIGISNKPERRRDNIDEDLPGSIKIVDTVLVYRATRLEHWLHDFFRKKMFVPRGAGRNAGKNEYARLTIIDVWFVRLVLHFSGLAWFLFDVLLGLVLAASVAFVYWVIKRY